MRRFIKPRLPKNLDIRIPTMNSPYSTVPYNFPLKPKFTFFNSIYTNISLIVNHGMNFSKEKQKLLSEMKNTLNLISDSVKSNKINDAKLLITTNFMNYWLSNKAKLDQNIKKINTKNMRLIQIKEIKDGHYNIYQFVGKISVPQENDKFCIFIKPKDVANAKINLALIY